MNEYFELVGRKMGSTPERWWFICAICISVSKSETARRPRTMADAPTSRATLTKRVETETMRTDGMWATTSSSMLLRSSRSNSAELFCGLRSAATTTSSKSRLARSTISRCPLWKGSNEPGNSPTFTSWPSRADWPSRAGSGAMSHGHERTAVPAFPRDHPPLGKWDRRRRLEDGRRRPQVRQEGGPGLEGVGRITQGEIEC